MNALCDSPARQSAGQINKIKWQTHYKASGSQAVRQAGIRRQVAREEWTRQVATSRQQVGNGIDVQQQCNAGCTAHSTLHKKMANNARRSKGTMVAQHTTGCRSYPPLLRFPLTRLFAAPLTCFLLLLHCSLAVAKCQRQWRRCLHWGIDAR